jgi:NADH-quinone oxidoreductase subunit C
MPDAPTAGPWLDRVADALGTDTAADGARAVADVDAARWRASVRICRDELGCDFFDWLSAVDEGDEGMRVILHVWNTTEHRGVLLRTVADDGAIDSIVDLYAGADWHERETHEMFGLDFPGHAELKPLLLPPEFEGHPLRKDFVLASRVVKAWPGEKEPGGGRPGGSKRAPKKPPGVPDGWLQEPEGPSTAPETDAPDGAAPDGAAE